MRSGRLKTNTHYTSVKLIKLVLRHSADRFLKSRLHQCTHRMKSNPAGVSAYYTHRIRTIQTYVVENQTNRIDLTSKTNGPHTEGLTDCSTHRKYINIHTASTRDVGVARVVPLETCLRVCLGENRDVA